MILSKISNLRAQDYYLEDSLSNNLKSSEQGDWNSMFKVTASIIISSLNKEYINRTINILAAWSQSHFPIWDTGATSEGERCRRLSVTRIVLCYELEIIGHIMAWINFVKIIYLCLLSPCSSNDIWLTFDFSSRCFHRMFQPPWQLHFSCK